MDWSAHFEIASPYTAEELYGMWCKFREDPNAEKILSDFMASDVKTAAMLVDKFECKYRYDHRYERE